MNKEIVFARIQEHQNTITIVKEQLLEQILETAHICAQALQNGNKLLFCGNGGSAADSQHLAAEFVGRYQVERDALPAIALTTDTSILTAVGNDYGFDNIFARQVNALGKAGDVLFALSTSGNSENVYLAAHRAKTKGLIIIGMTGQTGGKIKAISDVSLHVPVQTTARVQEAHILIGHILCELLDDIQNGK